MFHSQLDIIPVADVEHWHEALRQSMDYDFYHLPEYHAIRRATW